MLTAENVSAGYGKLHILEGVSIKADPGKISVVVGPNGSGKSTLLKTIAGLTTLYEGTIKMDDETLSHLPATKYTRRGLAYLPQNESVFTQLTVAENIKMARLHGLQRGSRYETKRFTGNVSCSIEIHG